MPTEPVTPPALYKTKEGEGVAVAPLPLAITGPP
jgi:hypothetical protein